MLVLFHHPVDRHSGAGRPTTFARQTGFGKVAGLAEGFVDLRNRTFRLDRYRIELVASSSRRIPMPATRHSRLSHPPSYSKMISQSPRQAGSITISPIPSARTVRLLPLTVAFQPGW